jgi:4-amino-4-deoxy-L-arabinose transferase-like glycosyltransferase
LRKQPLGRSFSIFNSAFAILLLAFALRLYHLGGQSIWFDEGWSWHLASMPLSEMAGVTAGDRSPPLYYALLHGWIGLAGDGEFAMRFISVLADTATVALVMRFAQLLVDPLVPLTRSTPALFAGLIYTVMPFALWYAQETRMYALVATLCTASSLFLWRWLKQMADRSFVLRHSSLVLCAVLLTFAVYCHYYAIFLLPAQFLAVLVYSWPIASHKLYRLPIVYYALAAVCVVAALIPWLVFASTGFAYDDGFYFPLNTIDGRMLEWVRGFASAGLARPLPDGWPIALGIPALLGVMGFVANKTWRALFVVLALIVGPLLAATVAVRVVYPNRSVFHPRYLIYLAPMTCVLFAGSLTLKTSQNTRRKTQGWLSVFGGLSSAICLGGLWLPLTHAYLTDPALQREGTRGATKHVVEALAPGDAVIMSRNNYAVSYYWPRVWRQAWSADYDPNANILLAAPDGLHGILKNDEGIFAKLNQNRTTPLKRVRLMLWQDDVVDPQKFIESSLWPNGFQIGEYNFAPIRLPLYQVDRWPLRPPDWVMRNTTFGDMLTLRSTWQYDRAFAGDWFYISLNWQPMQHMTTDYKIFVHVRDTTGKVAWQNDKLPLNALLPMTRWQTGAVYRDAHAMVIPADMPAGRYQVVAGVYDPISGQRLQTTDGPDVAVLGTVEVMRR